MIKLYESLTIDQRLGRTFGTSAGNYLTAHT